MDRSWLAGVAEFLGGFPVDFVAFDVETTGLDVASRDVHVVQFGYAVVRDGEIASWGDLPIDWTRGGRPVPAASLGAALDAVRSRMAARGKPYHVDLALLTRDGAAPEEAFVEIKALLEEGDAVVCHNGYAFDLPMLREFGRRVGAKLSVDPERVIDTGMIEKAGQLAARPWISRRDAWYADVARRRDKGVHWSLDGHCERVYRLSEHHGLDTANAHSAGFDAVACATLCLVYRDLVAAGSASVNGIPKNPGGCPEYPPRARVDRPAGAEDATGGTSVRGAIDDPVTPRRDSRGD